MTHKLHPPTQLRRGLGLWAAISVNVANMIGAGIFLKTRAMTCNVGSASMVLLVWVAAGLLSLAGTFSYAEVSAMLPEAGGDYVFLRRAYGKLVGFLYGWTFFVVARTGSQAALAVGFAIFLNVALGGGLEEPLWRADLVGLHLHLSILTIVALATLWAVAVMNCRPVHTGGHAAVILTLIKVLFLAGLGIGAILISTGHWRHLTEVVTGATCEGIASTARGGVAGFGAAMLGALWAYDGWNNVAPLAGEIKNPDRNLPRAFFGGMLVVGALYLLANLAYFYVMTPTEIGSVSLASSVATEVAQHFLGARATQLMAVALMISSLGALHASVLANSRIPFAMAREGVFFKSLSRLSPTTHVPIRAILAQAAWASVLALSGSYDALTDSVIFASWLFYGLSIASLFVFRYTMPNAHRPHRAFGYPVVPALFLLVTLWLLANTFVATPRLALIGLLAMLAGLPFYWIWSRSVSAVRHLETH